MIVKSMTDSEVINEIITDWKENAIPYYRMKLLSRASKYRRYVMTHDRNKAIFFNKIEYISPRNNRFVVVPFSRNRSDFKKRGLVFICYLTTNYLGCPRLFHITEDTDNPLNFQITIFCHHCIKRYCERFLKHNTAIDDNFYIELLKRNSVIFSSMVDTPNGQNWYAVSEDGIFIGKNVDANGLLLKTFISSHEYFENQELFANEMLREIIDYKRANHLLDYTGMIA